MSEGPATGPAAPDPQRVALAMAGRGDSTVHDTSHLLLVWAIARLIGRGEGLADGEQAVLESAALAHDIACPALRAELGQAPARLQEERGAAMAQELLLGLGCDPLAAGEVARLVATHHTLGADLGRLHQILTEADLIVNAMEKGPGRAMGQCALHVRTATGRELSRGILGQG